MHAEPVLFDLVAAEHAEQFIALQKGFHRFFAEVDWALAVRVVFEVAMQGLCVIHRISPHKVAKSALQGDLSKAVNLVDLVDLSKVFSYSSVHS